jgi:hypothetical protein
MEYKFENNIIKFKKGAKHANDYLIYHNETQIPDSTLFNWLFDEIASEEKAKKFLKAIRACPDICLKNEGVITNPSPLNKDEIYKYVSGLNSLSPKLRELLFVAILRCDIDNICYPPPRLNGCIRLFIQILLLFAYKYNWSKYFVLSTDKIKTTIPQYVFDAGFPNKKVTITKEKFKEIYINYLNNRN